MASSVVVPRSRWNSRKPGTWSSWDSRLRQISSKTSSRPGAMRKRFMAMYMGGAPFGSGFGEPT